MGLAHIFHKSKAFIGSVPLALILLGLSMPMTAQAMGDGKAMVTITNNMEDEMLAPIVISPIRSDGKIFVDDYVSAAAEHQILTGDPARTRAAIGRKAVIVHGTDGPSAMLLAPGKSITFEIRAGRGFAMRLLATVTSTRYEDHFVTGIINVGAGIPVTLDRLDIGYDEDRKKTELLRPSKVTVSVK